MQKILLKSAVFAVFLICVAVSSYAFDLFGWFKKDNSIESMIEYVPADTALFFGSISDEDMVASADEIMAAMDFNSIGSGISELLDTYPDSNALKFFTWLLEDYYSQSPKGGEAVYKHYGLDVNGASVLYMDGLFPVARIALTDEDAFINIVKQGAQEAGLELASTTLSGNLITTVELFNDGNASIELGFLVNDSVLTVSMLSDKDSSSALTQRFALTAPAQAMSTATWSQDGETYGYEEYFRGYISFFNIIQSLLNEDSLAFQQLKAFIGDDVADFSELENQCKEDILNIFSSVPRVVVGTNSYEIKNNRLAMDFGYTLEIKNAPILAELKKLRGFNPAYILGNSGLSFGVSLGLATDSISPVLTELWTQFIRADFNCAQLQEWQAQVANTNPAMIAMFTGMAQGLSGISAGVFDIVVDDTLPAGGTIDAIATVTAEKPEVLAALISNYLPMLQGNHIPTDGSVVNLADNGLPLDVFVAIKGKHLVAYSGEQSTKVANQLSNEKPVVNGLTSFTVDYEKVADILISASQPLNMTTDTDCTQLYSVATIMKNMPARVTGRNDITDNGIEVNWSMTIDNLTDMAKNYSVDIAGEYDLAFLDYDCTWIEIGTETLNEDGSGLYTEQDEAGACSVYESRYQWESIFGLLTQAESKNQYRDGCEQDWYEDDSYDFSCQMIASDDSGFYCLESDEEGTLYRYTKK